MTLTPTFDEDVTEYTAETSNATNKITATPKDESHTVTILNGETEIENGASATWEEGENVVTVTVSDGENENVYTATVTYTPSTQEETPTT